MGDLEWTNDLVIRLMQEYSKRPELWDPTHEMYRVHTLKHETWSELASMFDCELTDLRKKIASLFASHRREKAKIRAGGRSHWFLYPHMSFLPTHLDNDSADMYTAQGSTIKSERAPIREARARATDSSELEGLSEGEGSDAGSPAPASPALVKVERDVPASQRQRTHKPRLTRPVKRRRVAQQKPAPARDSRLTDAVKMLHKLPRKKDECDSFGEYIASSLRKHDERTQSMIKQAINNILFEQEMKRYSANNQPYSIIIQADENPLILSENDNTDR